MSHTSQLFITANRYVPEHDVFDSRPYIHFSTKLEVDFDKLSVEITFKKEKDEIQSRHNSKAYLYFEQNTRELIKLFEFLSRDKPDKDGQSENFDLNAQSGVLRTRRSVSGQISKESDHEYHVDLLRFTALPDRIVVETFEGNNPVFFYHETEQWNNPQDKKNLEKLQNFSTDVLDELKEEDTLKIEPVSDAIEKKLDNIKYGCEVLDHISDGNSCLSQGLNHPALNCYIHAIEWAIIAYLEDEEGIDIIEKEKNGHLYFFANRSDSLLSELKQYCNLSQKTITKIEGMNRTERRWSAHHKSGEMTMTEVNAIYSRLRILLNELFKPDN